MKEGYIIRDQRKAHFITATVVDWVDVFTRQIYCDAIIDCLDYCIKNKGMVLFGYVIMSNLPLRKVSRLRGTNKDEKSK